VSCEEFNKNVKLLKKKDEKKEEKKISIFMTFEVIFGLNYSTASWLWAFTF